MKNLILVVLLFVFFAAAGKSHAATLPTFPSCLNPQGTIKSTYSNGTHGIVGSSNSYSGSDTVYNVLGNSVTQCFCGSDGQGIQTNWFEVSGLTQGEIQDLKNDGWFEVPNGLAWGLADKPYLAKNSNYSCNTSRVGGASASNNTGNGDGVMGLASTGNSFILFLFAFGSVAALVAARILRKSAK